MTTDMLLEICVSLLEQNMKIGSTAELFKSVGGHIEDPIDVIATFIQDIDFHTSKSIEAKLDSAYLDSIPKEATAGELFMYRLRIENSIRSLELLSRAKSTCRVGEDIAEYAARWALGPLWKLCNTHWVYRTAEALHNGQQTALPPLACFH